MANKSKQTSRIDLNGYTIYTYKVDVAITHGPGHHGKKRNTEWNMKNTRLM